MFYVFHNEYVLCELESRPETNPAIAYRRDVCGTNSTPWIYMYLGNPAVGPGNGSTFASQPTCAKCCKTKFDDCHILFRNLCFTPDK